MAKRKKRIVQASVVSLFAARLRELRISRGMTQAELGQAAHVTTSYIGRLENAGAAPGIDLVHRLAEALATPMIDLLPAMPSSDTRSVLVERASQIFDSLLKTADRETLLMLCPLLARLNESLNRSR